MRVALGILSKEIERLQVEIDFLESRESNPPKLLRLKAEIEELLEAWQVLKDWKIGSSDPKDVSLCDRCPGSDEDKKRDSMLDRFKAEVTEEEWAVHLMNNPKDTQAEYEKTKQSNGSKRTPKF